MRAELGGRANPSGSARLRERRAGPFISSPDIGTPWFVLTEYIVVRQRITEELETVLAAPLRFFSIGMHGEAGHHSDIGIDRMTNRHAFGLDDVIVIIDPLLS